MSEYLDDRKTENVLLKPIQVVILFSFVIHYLLFVLALTVTYFPESAASYNGYISSIL